MMVMPKKSERERLADLEARQRKVAEEVEIARRAVRGRYASIIGELAVAELTGREFRELVDLAIWCGGAAARSEEHTSDLQSLMRNSSAVFCVSKTHK